MSHVLSKVSGGEDAPLSKQRPTTHNCSRSRLYSTSQFWFWKQTLGLAKLIGIAVGMRKNASSRSRMFWAKKRITVTQCNRCPLWGTTTTTTTKSVELLVGKVHRFLHLVLAAVESLQQFQKKPDAIVWSEVWFLSFVYETSKQCRWSNHFLQWVFRRSKMV